MKEFEGKNLHEAAVTAAGSGVFPDSFQLSATSHIPVSHTVKLFMGACSVCDCAACVCVPGPGSITICNQPPPAGPGQGCPVKHWRGAVYCSVSHLSQVCNN